MNSDIAKHFIAQWQKGDTTFTITTSGSTGIPKAIELQKRIMQWSAAHTASIIQPTAEDTLLCCIPCNKVGGLMMLVRALEWQIPVEILEPMANPFLDERNASIVSLTPYQLFYILNDEVSTEHFKKVRAVIIGGGELSPALENKLTSQYFESTIFYHSYGMTETYSHIALRAINGLHASTYFTPFSDVKISMDENNCAVIQLPFELDALHTTDLIQLQSNGDFEITGRADFIINTGGVKIQPELIEKAIKEKLNPQNAFIISSEKDEALGHKLILIAEKNFEYNLSDLNFLKSINTYAVPKEIRIIETFDRNASDKIVRF
ncbi:MAG: AMP-binding protein [bacterium]|nr:AMP-binding protein [bacterium]